MISINDIKSYVPKNHLDLTKYHKNVRINFLKEKIGTLKVSRKQKNEDVVQMCIKAYKKLKLKDSKNIKLLILCTQNPEKNGLPHNSALIHNELNLNKDIATFDVSQGCAGYVYCLKICDGFLKKNEKALIFTCDPYSKIIKKKDFNTEILFGDAASVSLVEKKNQGNVVDNFVFYSDTNENEAINNFEGNLEMDGRKVMNFASTVVKIEIRKILNKTGIKIKNINKFYFHQGSKHIIEQLIKILKIDKKKVPILFKNIGNTISSSIPLLLEKDKFKTNKLSLLCGFGVGLSIATCIMKKK